MVIWENVKHESQLQMSKKTMHFLVLDTFSLADVSAACAAEGAVYPPQT